MKLTRRGFFGAAGASVVAVAVLPAPLTKVEVEDEHTAEPSAAKFEGRYVEANNLANEMLARLRKHGIIA